MTFRETGSDGIICHSDGYAALQMIKQGNTIRINCSIDDKSN